MAMHHAHSKPQALRRETALLIPVWPPARKWLCTMLIASRKPYDGRRPCWYLHFPIKRQSLVIIYRWKAHEYYIIMNNQSKLRHGALMNINSRKLNYMKMQCYPTLLILRDKHLQKHKNIAEILHNLYCWNVHYWNIMRVNAWYKGDLWTCGQPSAH